MSTRLVVEWTRASLRLAIAEGSGSRWRLRGLRSEPITATVGVREALRTLLKTIKPTSSEILAVVSREQVITRVVKFPTVEAVELAQMAELYAKAQLPYQREQTVMDFHVLSQQGGFSTIAIVACQREVVDRQLLALREAGVSVGLVTVSSWGVLGWYHQAVSKDTSNEPVLIVNIDDTRTDLVLIGEGQILSSRSVGQGAQDWGGAGETSELLALEVERSRAAIRKELPGTEVRSLLLTGLGTLAQWKDQLAPRLSLPVVAIESQQTLKGVTPALSTPISPIVVVGLACSDSAGLLNLSPPEVRVQVRHRRQIRELVVVSLLLMGVLALGSSLLSLQLRRQQGMATELDHALNDMAPAAKRVQEQTRFAQLVHSVLADRRRVALTLGGVFRETPSTVTLESLTFEHTKHEVVVRGSAASNQDVLGYIKQLEQLKEVSGVDLRYSTRHTTPTGERTDFELVLHQHGAST